MEQHDVPNVNFFIGYVKQTKAVRGQKYDTDYVNKYSDERRFYSSNKNHDYVEYVNNGSKEKLDYVSYSGNKEKSHGIFNENGLMDKKQIKELREQLGKTNSIIWHGVISFSEEFGNVYCGDTDKAIKLMKIEWPKFLKNAGLNPSNVIWYAGLHENTDNKHIHFSFFEKSPQHLKRGLKMPVYSKPKIPLKAINKVKVSMEIRLLDIYKEIAFGRKTLTEELKKQLELEKSMNELKTLVVILPNEGRLSYDSANMMLYKQQINSVVNAIIKSNKDLYKKFTDFEKILSTRDSELIKAYSKIHIDYEDKLLRDKCIDDLYRRLGNIVLYTIKEIRYEQKKEDYETRNRLIQKHIEKKKKKILFDKCMRLNELVDSEVINAFREYIEKIEEATMTIHKEEGIME